MWSYHPYVDHSYTRPYEFAKNDDTHGVARNSENFEAENDTENVIGAWTNDIEQECQATVKIQNDDDDERLEVDTTIEICINEFDFDNKDWFRNMHDAENNEADRRLECVENSCGGIILKDENIMYDEANVAENNIISGDEANNAESSVINSDEANNAENNITNSDEANDAEHNIISGDEASDAENNIMNGDEANDAENNIISGDEASDAENNINNGDEASDVENNIIKGDDINCIGNMCEADLVENENVAYGHSYDSAINTTTAQLRIGKTYGDIHVRNENVMYSDAHASEDNDNDSCIGVTRTHKDKHVKKKTMVCQYLTYCYKTKINAENSEKKRHKYYIEYTYEDEHVTEKNNINCDGEGMEMGTSIQENAMFVDTSSVENSRSVDASSSVENSMSVDTNENAVENMEWSIEEHDHDHEENDESDNGESDKSDNSVGETCEDYHIVKEENVMMYEDCHGRDTEIYTSFLGYENVDENKDFLFNYTQETENGEKGSRVVNTVLVPVDINPQCFHMNEQAQYNDAEGKGMSMEKDTSIEKGMSMEKDTSTEKGMSMEKDTSTEKGMSMEKDMSTEKGMSIEKGMSMEKDMSTEKGMSIEKGMAIEKGTSMEKSTSTEKGMSTEVFIGFSPQKAAGKILKGKGFPTLEKLLDSAKEVEGFPMHAMIEREFDIETEDTSMNMIEENSNNKMEDVGMVEETHIEFPVKKPLDQMQEPMTSIHQIINDFVKENHQLHELDPPVNPYNCFTCLKECGTEEELHQHECHQRGPPTIPLSKPVVTEIGEETVRLAWKPSIFQRLKVPLTYNLEVKMMPNPAWLPLVNLIKAPTYYFSELQTDVDYYIRVRAKNKYGFSEPTEPVWIPRATVFPGVPVQRPKITEIEQTSARVSWDLAKMPESMQPQLFMLEVLKPPSKYWHVVTKDIPDSSHIVTDLKPGQDYLFRVRARTFQGKYSKPSPHTSLYKTLATSRVPIDKLELDHSDCDADGISLKWSRVDIPPFHTEKEPLFYMVEMKESPIDNWRPLVSGLPITRYKVMDLLQDRDYIQFRVRAVTPYGLSPPTSTLHVSYSRPPTATSGAPIDKLELDHPDCDDDGISLKWRRVDIPPFHTEKEPLFYMVEMKESPIDNWRPLVSDLPITKYKVTGLPQDRDYKFRVRAVAPYGLSPPTNTLHVYYKGTLTVKTPSSLIDHVDVKAIYQHLNVNVCALTDADAVKLTWNEPPLYSKHPIKYVVKIWRERFKRWHTLASDVFDTFYIIKGIHPCQSYKFMVIPMTEEKYGINCAGGIPSKPVPVAINQKSPEISFPDAESLMLSWEQPQHDLEMPLKYRIDVREFPDLEWRPLATEISGTKCIVKSLNPRRDYNFKVTPMTSVGDLESLPFVTLTSVPVPTRLHPAEPIATMVGKDTVKLSWQPAEIPFFSRDKQKIRYSVDMRLLSNDLEKNEWTTIACGISDITYLYTFSESNPIVHSYQFRIRGFPDSASVRPSPMVTVYRHADLYFPRNEPVFTAIGPDFAVLSWKPAILPDIKVNKTKVTYKIEVQDPPLLGKWCLKLPRNKFPYVVDHQSCLGLLNERDFLFRVSAQIEIDNIVTQPTMLAYLPRRADPPRIPLEEPTFSNITPQSVMLEWKSVEQLSRIIDYSRITYRLEIQEVQQSKWTTHADEITKTKFHVTNLCPNKEYKFRVRAKNEKGLSEPTPFTVLGKRLEAMSTERTQDDHMRDQVLNDPNVADDAISMSGEFLIETDVDFTGVQGQFHIDELLSECLGQVEGAPDSSNIQSGDKFVRPLGVRKKLKKPRRTISNRSGNPNASSSKKSKIGYRQSAPKGQYLCHVCSKVYNHERSLLEHLKRHDDSFIFKCNVCITLFDSEKACMEHRNNAHKVSHLCSVCGVKFKNKWLLQCHSRTHLSQMDKDKFKYPGKDCKICGAVYTNKMDLFSHTLSVHNSLALGKSEPLFCPFDGCDKMFIEEVSLQRHLRVHERDKKKINSCSKCDKKFISMRSRDSHQRVCSGEK